MKNYRVWGRDWHAQNRYSYVCQLAKPHWWSQTVGYTALRNAVPRTLQMSVLLIRLQ